MELEYVFPFYKNKWSVILEPTYQYFKSKKTTDNGKVSGGKLISEVNFSSIEIPIGIRHYFFLENNDKIFANISYVFHAGSKSSVDFKRVDNTILNSLDITSGKNIAIGLGYKLKDKYSLEMRYQSNREILRDYLYWNSNYSTISFIFGYTIF